MTGSSFAAIVNKFEEFGEFVKAGKIINVSARKVRLEALQNQNNPRRNLSSRKRKEKLLLCGIKTSLLDQNFKTTIHTYLLTTQTSDLFTTPLSTLLVLIQITQVHSYHLFRLLNQTCKFDPDSLIIQCPFYQVTKPITIPKSMKFKIKTSIKHLSIWADLSTNYVNNSRLLARLALCLLKPILEVFSHKYTYTTFSDLSTKLTSSTPSPL